MEIKSFAHDAKKASWKITSNNTQTISGVLEMKSLGMTSEGIEMVVREIWILVDEQLSEYPTAKENQWILDKISYDTLVAFIALASETDEALLNEIGLNKELPKEEYSSNVVKVLKSIFLMLLKNALDGYTEQKIKTHYGSLIVTAITNGIIKKTTQWETLLGFLRRQSERNPRVIYEDDPDWLHHIMWYLGHYDNIETYFSTNHSFEIKSEPLSSWDYKKIANHELLMIPVGLDFSKAQRLAENAIRRFKKYRG